MEDSETQEFSNPEYLIQDTDYTTFITDHIVLESATQVGDSYNGNKLVQEEGTGVGDVTDVHLSSPGNNYDKLPIITIATDGDSEVVGSGGKILCYGNEIGKIINSKIIESGAQYELSPPPTLSLRTKLIVTGATGEFSPEGTVTGETSDGTPITATVVSFDSNRGLLSLSNATGTFGNDTIITDSTIFTTATVKIFDQATATTTVGAVANTSGAYINQDGHVSENTMKIQDSLYYQDFSYVIEVGQSINLWRDSFKKTIHTGGFFVTGQVNIETRVAAGINFPVEGIISGVSESPIFGILNTLFTTIFGRRLGTEDDGTTLRANAHLGVDPNFDDITSEHFDPTTRDLTLTRKMKVSFPSIAKIVVRGDEYKFGYAYCGPRMKTLNIYDNPFGTDNMFSPNHPSVQVGTYTASGGGSTKLLAPMKLVNWADHTIIGLNNSLNGTGVQIQDYENDNLKTYISYPTEITASVPGISFDRTDITYDNTGFTFDETF